ncbi:hypothetical protein HKW97_25655 (plasmid) [Pseudomonas luteola]|uniref:hypothetical protein n=1 Tax=Pseudomonas luteola TaxID=47886 RepID=UPI00388F5A93
MAGVLAISAGIVVGLIDKDSFYQNLPEIWSSFKELYFLLFAVVVVSIAVCVIPLAEIWMGIKTVIVTLTQSIDDDYLSNMGFYSFVKELLGLIDCREKRLLIRTREVIYWTIQVSTAPIKRIPAIIKHARRMRRKAKQKNLAHFYNPALKYRSAESSKCYSSDSP